MDANSHTLIVNRILTRFHEDYQQDIANFRLPVETVSARQVARNCFRDFVLFPLGHGEARQLVVGSKHMLELLLDNFHDMQLLLAGQETKLEVVTIGHSRLVKFGHVSLTTNQEILWMEFLTFLNDMNLPVLRIAVGGKMVIQALQTLRVAAVALEIPYPIKLRSDEHTALIRAVDGDKGNRERLMILIVGMDHCVEQFEAASMEGCMGDGSLIHSLFQVQDFQCLHFELVDILLQDSMWLASNISSEECPIKALHFMQEVTFIDDGGAIVANAIKHNTSLTSIVLSLDFHDENFKDDALAEVLKENYTITKIDRGDVVNGGFAGAIAILNAAGRGYVQTNSDASKEDCVEVLIKVRDNLIALFLLLRENPMLFY